MGGYGSGQWERIGTKATVDDSMWLDVNWITREGLFDSMTVRRGTILWTHPLYGNEISRIGYELSPPNRWLRLEYRLVQNSESFDYKIGLTTTDLPWGGVRWWFICLLICNGQYCGRRVAKLYLPPGGSYFGCRHCYNLTYTSCQDSHKYDRMFGAIKRAEAQSLLEIDQENRDEQRICRRIERREQLRRRSLQKRDI